MIDDDMEQCKVEDMTKGRAADMRATDLIAADISPP